MTEESLREVVATVAQLNPGDIGFSTPFSGSLAQSLGRARLAAALRTHYNISNADVYKANSFGALCQVLGVPTGKGNAYTIPTPEPAREGQASHNVSQDLGTAARIGIDIEPVDALPNTADLWEDSFYQETFTPQEIAYAQLRPVPRASLAAMWCAKEALRKSDSHHARLAWHAIEVIHNDDGKPSIQVNGRSIAGSLSISHTDTLACAVFVTVPFSGATVSEKPPAAALPAVVPRISRKPMILSCVALATALAALVRVLLLSH